MAVKERRKKILVCEDDEELAELLQILLEAGGYEVTLAADGTRCLEAFSRVRPDMLILDLDIPHKNGYQVLEQLREQGRTRDACIFVMSTEERTSDILRCQRLGAAAYITKPFDVTVLLAEIDKALKAAVGR
jgi:DNA-binding response OmpR family regulator